MAGTLTSSSLCDGVHALPVNADSGGGAPTRVGEDTGRAVTLKVDASALVVMPRGHWKGLMWRSTGRTGLTRTHAWRNAHRQGGMHALKEECTWDRRQEGGWHPAWAVGTRIVLTCKSSICKQ